MVDSTDIIEGEGPMTPTRSGALPVMPLIELCFSGKYGKDELIMKIVKSGGLTAHLGTDDLREVEGRIESGDSYAKIVYDTMVYQIVKYAGSMAAVLGGRVDQILITGGMAKSGALVGSLSDKLSWIAPSTVFPGEFELEGLAAGVMRVVNGEETAKTYTGVDVWTGFQK
jgi:butyrate kinase